jgi:hypothetical protein
MNDYDKLRGKYERDVAAMANEIEKLRGALEKYARHDWDCAKITEPMARCTCGLEELGLGPG